MPVKPFKELERKDINQPDDKVTVTVAPAEGLTTAEGFKQQGEPFEMPASQARLHQKAGMVSIGENHPGEELTVRIEAHNDYWDSRKAVEKAVKEARENASKDAAGDNPEQLHGQAGLALADSGDPARFSSTQDEYERRLAANSANAGGAEAASESGGDAKPKDESEKDSSADDSYEDMHKTELESEAKGRGISVSGKTKAQLAEELREDDRKKE